MILQPIDHQTMSKDTTNDEEELMTSSSIKVHSPPTTTHVIRNRVYNFFVISRDNRPEVLLLMLCGFFFVNTVTVFYLIFQTKRVKKIFRKIFHIKDYVVMTHVVIGRTDIRKAVCSRSLHGLNRVDYVAIRIYYNRRHQRVLRKTCGKATIHHNGGFFGVFTSLQVVTSSLTPFFEGTRMPCLRLR